MSLILGSFLCSPHEPVRFFTRLHWNVLCCAWHYLCCTQSAHVPPHRTYVKARSHYYWHSVNVNRYVLCGHFKVFWSRKQSSNDNAWSNDPWVFCRHGINTGPTRDAGSYRIESRFKLRPRRTRKLYIWHLCHKYWCWRSNRTHPLLNPEWSLRIQNCSRHFCRWLPCFRNSLLLLCWSLYNVL